MKRIIDPSENVYLIQLSWKGAGRFILEDKDKLANEHGTLTETYSEPLGAKAGLSPSLRRQSRYVFVNWRLVQNVKYRGSPLSMNKLSVIPGIVRFQIVLNI